MKRFLILSIVIIYFFAIKAQETDNSFLEQFVYPEFVRYEATYQNQKISLPRSSASNPYTLGDQLKRLFGSTSDFTDAYVCIGSLNDDIDTLSLDLATLLRTDPIMLAYDKSENGLSKKYDEPNVTINLRYKADDGQKRYLTIFMRVRGFLNRGMYARMTIMAPGNEVDNLKTYQSTSEPFVVSYITSFVANQANFAEDLKYYESVDSSLREKLQRKEKLSKIENSLLEGVYENSMNGYDDGYAMWMYNDKRYSDAFHFFEKVYLANRADILSGKEDNKDMFYRSCYYMWDCLNKLGISDKAKYYLSLAALNGGEYADTYSRLQRAKVSKRELHSYQYIDENKYDLNAVTAGQVLHSIYDVIPEYILSGRINMNNESRSLSSREAWDVDLKSLCSEVPSVLILKYSKAKFETQSTIDESKLFYSNSIILTVHKVSSSPSLWRVNIMIPNFRSDDDKKDQSEYNCPSMSSFIISNEKIKWNLQNNKEIVKKCYSLIDNKRCAEAMLGFKLVYLKLLQQSGGKKVPELQKELCMSAGVGYGYALIELNSPYKAIYYLQPNAEAGGHKEKQEYVNALCRLQDVRTMDIIEKELKSINSYLQKHPKNEEYISCRNFILRRKAYILIDQQKYDEAETILKLQKDLEKDPEKLRLVENELNYIMQVKNR